MSDQIKEFVEMPKQFMKEGSQFVNRCTKPDRKGKNWFSLIGRAIQNLAYLNC